MIALPSGVRIWLAAGMTDMRKGFDGVAMLVQQQLGKDLFGGQLFVFRGRRSHLIKILVGWPGTCSLRRNVLTEGGSCGRRPRMA